LTALAVGVCAQSSHKDHVTKHRLPIAKHDKSINASGAQQKAPGDLIYENHFDNSAEWFLSAPNTQGEWVYTTTTPANISTYMGAMASTSSADGFGAFDGIGFLLAGSVDPQDAYMELLDTIDLSAYPAVSISFEQRYRAFNSDQTFLEVSGDNGGSWTQIEVNDAVVTNDPATQNTLNLNVSPYIGGASQALIRFRWYEQSGDDAFGSGYGWMIDDLEIREAQGYDVALLNSSWYHNSLYKVQYSSVPLDQVANVFFDGSIENIGAAVMENTTLTVGVTGAGTGSAASTPLDLSALTTVMVETATSFAPSAVGTYNAVYTASGDSADADLLNNTLAETWEVSSYIYGKDDGAMVGSYGPFDDDGDMIDDPYELVVEYEMNANTTFTGILACLSTASTDGAEIYYNLYYDDGAGGFIPEYDGLSVPVPTMIVNTADFTATGGANWIPMPFPSPLSVDMAVAPAVYAVVGYQIDPVNFCTAGTAPDTSNYLTVFATTAGQSDYYITSKPMIRLTEDPALGLSEEEYSVSLGQNIPNPTNATTAIPYNLVKSANVEFIVTDMMGKIIEKRDMGALSSGDHSLTFDTANMASGVYYYSIIADGQISTKKMSVAK
jgi:hypothetical protein